MRSNHLQQQIHEFQRRRQQGLGKPIISAQTSQSRVVAVYNRILRGPWKTFHDFLFHYIKITLGETWGADELAKPVAQRHPVLHWYQLLCSEQAKNAKKPGETYGIEMTGAISAYLRLAYDLYTLEHNREQANDLALQAKLITRLKRSDQFVGARHEIRIAAMFLRAGFCIEWEDEADRSKTHCEFTATYPKTGCKFGVECKIRQPEDTRPLRLKQGKFVGLVVNALRKQTPHRRIVFVELNTEASPSVSKQRDWCDWALHKLRTLETNPQSVKLPPAYIFITHFPDHHHLETVVPDASCVVEGFKLSDYRASRRTTLREAIQAREHHVEMEALIASMREHTDIPSTFEGEISELKGSGARLLIGHRYQMDDGKIGILVNAVPDNDGKVALVLQMEDGDQLIYEGQLSENELGAWRRYPETFFGELKTAKHECRDILDFYDFFLATHSQSTKEQLLSLMTRWPDQVTLSSMSQLDLAKMYSESLANQTMILHNRAS